jgi:hypothetical protein
MGLFFGKNEVKTLVELQENHEDLYTSLMAEANVALKEEQKNPTIDPKQAEIDGLKQTIANGKEDNKIASYANKIGVSVPKVEERGERMSFSDALLVMVDASLQKQENLKETFEETTSEPAGSSTEQGDQNKPKTKSEAMAFVKERDGLATSAAAMEVVKVEFKELFTN